MSRDSHLLRAPLMHKLLLFVAQLGRGMEEIVISRRHGAAIHDGRINEAIALRCFTSIVAQFEKFRAARPFCAPNKYDGASFALQEPLPPSEWQSKQAFLKIS